MKATSRQSQNIQDRRNPNSRLLRRVYANLVLQGHTLTSWAEAKGYLPRTANQVVTRYAGTQDQPRGRLSWKILCELSQDTGIELVPGSLKEVA